MPLLNLPKHLLPNRMRNLGNRVAVSEPPFDSQLSDRGTDGQRNGPGSNDTICNDSVRPIHPGNQGTSAGSSMEWNRNLSWQQREAASRLRRSQGLVPLEEWPGNAGLHLVDMHRANGTAANPLFATCMNPHCETNWLRLWRRRQAPRLEGQWACSPECMRVFVEQAVARELAKDAVSDFPWGQQPRRHRMPLGLILLGQGWVTEAQLRAALEAQRTVGKGRIGTWLMRQCNLSEEKVTRALSMQWGCPVLSAHTHQAEATATLIPRLFLDSFGLLPVRVASGRILYVGFEDRIDAAAALAIHRMTGLRVETGVVAATQFLRAHQRMMGAAYPKAVLAEADNASRVADILSEAVERVRPHEARLVRMHHYLWLRMWRTPMPVAPAISTGETTARPAGATSGIAIPRIHQVEDLLCLYQPQGSQVHA